MRKTLMSLFLAERMKRLDELGALYANTHDPEEIAVEERGQRKGRAASSNEQSDETSGRLAAS
jgi:hypothetical protein